MSFPAIHVISGMTRHRCVQHVRPSPASEDIFDEFLKHVGYFHSSQNMLIKNVIERNIYIKKNIPAGSIYRSIICNEASGGILGELLVAFSGRSFDIIDLCRVPY